MQADLNTRVLRYIHEHGMLAAGDRVGIGVSGGADSVALLRLLDELKAELGIQLVVLHFNHKLRGAESDVDQAFVCDLAATRGFECIMASEDVAAAARSTRVNLEDAARRMRYGFFADVLKSRRITRVAVAHTADDQAETVLARLVRGTGPAGLASIYPVKEEVVRPLLQIRRAELRQYLGSASQPWREDSSNQDLTRLRAYLRHKILPLLERDLQPAIANHLGSVADFAREDETFWSAFIAERVGALTKNENGRIGIRRSDLIAPLNRFLKVSAPQRGGDPQRAIARRLVRAIVASLPGTARQLTARHVEQVLHLAENSTSGHRTDLPRAFAERAFDWIWFEAVAADETNVHDAAPSSATEANAFSHAIDWSTQRADVAIALPEIGRCVRLKMIDWVRNESETNSGAVIDGELLRPPLLLRSWRPGDSFRPQGRRRPLKLKQFLRESRVALRDRSGWPVLTSGGLLVWARGLPVAVEFSPCQETRTAVLITEEAM